MLKKSILDFFNSRVAARVRAALRFSNTYAFEKRAAHPMPRYQGVYQTLPTPFYVVKGLG